MEDSFIVISPDLLTDSNEEDDSLSTNFSDLFLEKIYKSQPHKIYEKELAVYPDLTTAPQTRTKCVSWLKIDKPYCDFRGCGTERIKTCKGWKTETKQYLHTLRVIVYGPEFSRDEVVRLLKEAAITAAVMGAISYFSGGNGVSKKLEDEIRKKIVAGLGVETIDVELRTSGRWDRWR